MAPSKISTGRSGPFRERDGRPPRAGEFIAKKAIILGLTAKQVAEGVKAGENARAKSGGSSPPPPPASPKKKKSGGKADKEPRMELPTKALDPFMKELCECQQDNPKRKGSKSAETYDLRVRRRRIFHRRIAAPPLAASWLGL